MALLYRNQYLDKKDDECVSNFKQELRNAKSLYHVYKKNGLKMNFSKIEEMSLPADRVRQILYSRIWDKSSIYHEIRDCSYFPNRSILNRLIKEYLYSLQLYSSLAELIFDSIADHTCMDNDVVDALNTYGQLLTDRLGYITYNDNQYLNEYRAIENNASGTDISISIGSLGPFNSKDDFGVTKYPFNDNAISYYNGWGLSKLADDNFYYRPYNAYAMQGKTIVINKLSLYIEIAYLPPTLTFYPNRTSRDSILCPNSYIHYLTNVRKKYVIKLNTPLRLINPFYKNIIKNWIDNDDY